MACLFRFPTFNLWEDKRQIPWRNRIEKKTSKLKRYIPAGLQQIKKYVSSRVKYFQLNSFKDFPLLQLEPVNITAILATPSCLFMGHPILNKTASSKKILITIFNLLLFVSLITRRFSAQKRRSLILTMQKLCNHSYFLSVSF